MATKTRPTPDDFQEPERHDAASKTSVNSVLSRVAQHGNTLLSVLFGLLAAVLILYSGYILYDTVYTENNASTPIDLLKYRPEIIDNGASPDTGSDVLAEINKDYRAWLTMYNTAIDYPVVQGADDLYYATHDIYKNASLTGSIYFAAGNAPDVTDSYNVIYGHHMDNGAMFGGLDLFVGQDYFNANREGLLVTTKGVFDLRTFAFIDTDAYENKIYDVGDRMTDVLSFLREMKAQSDGKTVVHFLDESTLQGAEQIVALSTCRDAATNGRLVLFATMTRRNLMTITASSIDAVYDGQPHKPDDIKVNYEDDTTVTYSTDGGKTWQPGLPEIQDVGTVDVILRAENPYYGTYELPITMTIEPKPITVNIHDKFKVYGEPDPEWTMDEVTGIVDGFKPVFTIRRTNADEEDVGTYKDVIVAEGETRQGNYVITFVPGDFSITAADTLAIIVDELDVVYDGEEHGLPRVEVNVPEGTVIEYSTDGGKTWTTEEPKIRDVGTLEVIVRATNPNYEPITETVVLTIEPAEVTVVVNFTEKTAGEDDPEYTVTVTGVVDGYVIQYTIHKDDSVTDEPGTYPGAIIVNGEEFQGNYHVTYVNGDLSIKEPAPEKGNNEGEGKTAWALINLISLIVTAYVLLPLLHLKDKYGRVKIMKKINEENRKAAGQMTEDGEVQKAPQADGESGEEKPEDEDVYNVKKFKRNMSIGVGLEVLAAVGAIVLFILTEDMRRPMVLVDRWTIVMVLILAIGIVADILFCRKPKRKELKKEEEKFEKSNQEAEATGDSGEHSDLT